MRNIEDIRDEFLELLNLLGRSMTFDLGDFETVANLIEYSLEPDVSDQPKVESEVFQNMPSHILEFRDRVRFLSLMKILENKPDRFNFYILNGKREDSLSEIDVFNSVVRYKEFFRRAKKIRAAVWCVENLHLRAKDSKSYPKQFQMEVESVEIVTLNKNWEFQSEIVPDPFFTELDIRRISLCSRCGRVFFGRRSRVDLKNRFCSVTCGNAYRQKRYLGKTKEREKDLLRRRLKYKLTNLHFELSSLQGELIRVRGVLRRSKLLTRIEEIKKEIEGIEKELEYLKRKPRTDAI